MVASQYRRFKTVDVRGCAAITDSVGVSAWLEHSRVRFTGNDADNVLQPPPRFIWGIISASGFETRRVCAPYERPARRVVAKRGTNLKRLKSDTRVCRRCELGVDDRMTTTECAFGVLVSRLEFEPFRLRENGQNSDLDANIECGGCVPETVGGRRGDVTNAVTAETAKKSPDAKRRNSQVVMLREAAAFNQTNKPKTADRSPKRQDAPGRCQKVTSDAATDVQHDIFPCQRILTYLSVILRASRRIQPQPTNPTRQPQSPKTKHSTGTPFPRRCQKMFHGD